MFRSKYLSTLIIGVSLLVPIYGASALITRDAEPPKDFSIQIENENAFSQPLVDLTLEEEQQFILGQRIFHEFTSQDKPFELKGIGPRFNAFNCADCHARDGRSDPETSGSLVIKLYNSKNNQLQDPIYGSQINTFGIDQSNTEVNDSFWAKNSTWRDDLLLGPLDKNTIAFKRIAPETFGLGLVESIPDAWFLENHDPEDLNNDGISGRINWIKDHNGENQIGRFGWKATQPRIEDQVLHAAFNDLGLSNSRFSQCKTPSIVCNTKNDLNIKQEQNLSFYIRALAPPSARTVSKDQKKGKDIFIRVGCAACHTITAPIEKNSLTKTKNGVIYPHSDFLLHSMGPRLTDPNKLGSIAADEFRTAPLWGFGLREKVNGSLNLLHDGRASSVEEAIDFHGGEAEQIRKSYFALDKADKNLLLSYLNSL